MEKVDNYIKLFQNTSDIQLKWKISYELAKIYLKNNDIENTQKWVITGYQIVPERIENLYLLVKYFREKGMNEKAYFYYNLRQSKNKPEGLNIESDIYDFLYDYEETLLYYYLYPNDKLGGLKKSIQYLNNTTNNFDNVFNNLEYYIQPLSNDKKILKFDKVHKFINSSPSITRLNDDKYLLNIRYHNYYITNEGHYLSHQIENNQYIVRTRNSFIYLDNNFNPISSQEWMPEDLSLPQVQTRIKGLEDMRIFTYHDKLYYVATSCHYSPQFRIIFGEYNHLHNKLENNIILQPPIPTNCEKNWIPLIWNDRINFIYSWHPLQIGFLQDNKLQIFHTQQTPNYFSKARGSSNICHYKDELWTVTHSVKYTSPRKYYHQIVVFDAHSLKLKRFSLPFNFNSMTIEYCLSLIVENDTCTFFYSVMDSNSNFLQVPIDSFKWVEI